MNIKEYEVAYRAWAEYNEVRTRALAGTTEAIAYELHINAEAFAQASATSQKMPLPQTSITDAVNKLKIAMPERDAPTAPDGDFFNVIENPYTRLQDRVRKEIKAQYTRAYGR